MIRGVKHITPVKFYSYTSRSRLHNIISSGACAPFILLIFYNQKYSKLKNVTWCKKIHCEEICKRLDFLVFSDKDDKSYAPSHNPGTNLKFFGTIKNPRTVLKL